MSPERKKTLLHASILGICALLWGFTFVSQSIGADYVGAFTFLAMRCWIAVVFLIPVTAAVGKIRLSRGLPSGRPENRRQRKVHLTAGAACGAALFAASAAQQAGIGCTTAAKAGFISAMYVVLVPVFSIFLGHIPARKLWISVLLGVTGLYLLCFTGGFGGFEFGDLILLLCAALFSVQILVLNHFLPMVEAVRLSHLQLLFEGIFATVCMFLFEHPGSAEVKAALPAALFAGIMSSGVAYTLQIIGQKGLDPTVASLIMCLESVFSAVGGWLFLGQTLSARELSGCVLMFAAIVLSELPSPPGLARKR